MLLIGVAVNHAQLLHHPAAVGVMDVVSGGDKGIPGPAAALQNRAPRLGGDALSPMGPAQPIAQVVGVRRADPDVADGAAVFLYGDGT